MTPLERAQRAVEQWNPHWAKSAAANVLLMNIKREIEGAILEEREACALTAASAEHKWGTLLGMSDDQVEQFSPSLAATAIRKRGAP
jgi:hypothetical protein